MCDISRPTNVAADVRTARPDAVGVDAEGHLDPDLAAIARKAGVPLVVEGKPIGVMTVQHYSDPNAYGLPEQQVLEWRAVVQERFREYRRCMEQYEGFEPPWKMGRQLFWNITGAG